jgi:FkbM family methyltransferase
MANPLAYYLDKVKDEGVRAIVSRRIRWYSSGASRAFSRTSRQVAGRIVEGMGNRVRINGAVFSTNSPLIETSQKGEMLFGWHEREERRLLKRWLRVDLPIVEFGGGLGVISCLANRRLDRPEKHVVVEANPEIVPLLEQNRVLNGCRFRVVNKALVHGKEAVEFGINSRFTASRIDGPGTSISVGATTLAAIADESGFDQISLICDIEGAETALVEHEIDALRKRVRMFLVEIHPGIIGEEAESRIIGTLESAGFVLREHHGINWAFTHD